MAIRLQASQRGALWMVGTLLSFVAMAVSVRLLSARMGTFEILFLRCLVALLLLAPLLLRPGALSGPWQMWRQLGRNLIHFGAQYCWTLGIALLPLTDVFALEFTTPIWVTALATLLLRERLTGPRVVAAVGGFLGVLIVLRPGAEVFDPAALIVLAAAFGFAASIVMVRAMTRQGVSPAAIVLWMTVLQLPMGMLPALYAWTPPVWADLPSVVVAGFTGLSAHYCMARALQLGDASVLLPIEFLRVPLIAVAGFALFGEPISPWVVVGAAVIFAANYYAVTREAPSANTTRAASSG